MPVAMPDGGRDAVVSQRSVDRLVFQVKYRRRTPLAEATHDDYLTWLQDSVKNEISSIHRLLKKGIRHYVLISNAPCSSHSESGTRDKMRSWLSELLPNTVEIDVWWRDDLDRRLDSNWELKRTYGLISSTVSADTLLAGMTADETITSSRFLTVRKFIRTQYDRDALIRFREADLPAQPLLQCYLDIGATPHITAEAERRRFAMFRTKLKYTPVDSSHGDGYYYGMRPYAGASLLLQLAGTNELIRTVIEGAPGQGKSTLIQYVCQIHRSRLLGKDLRSVPAPYRTCPILLPFRTDLRDLAAWFQGDNPFDEKAKVDHYPRSIEGFLAALVHISSGGGSFTVDDLDEIIASTPVLLAFDGLDEVADIGIRGQIVDELSDCANRLQEIGREVRFIVTSRPSAFSAAPRFPNDRFTYVTLTNLNRPLIMEYTKTWMRTRRVEPAEARKLTDILIDKLREPHIAELARNSMQLAILLWLIYQQQGNLPEQRTSLYEQYISTFLTREAGKSKVIREHGGTVLQLHGYLAWVLHARAESGRSRGNIAEGELKSLLRQYLSDVGYSQPDLIDALFQGMAERFIALVSRIQGTWEFEVQPLREYFAAYHLYDTARMSRAGKEVTGTKADRFDALAANPYWLNVTRFYVGFFDKGELAYLLHQFHVGFEQGAYCRQTYSRTLANSIIADQVFIQSPGMGRELTKLIAKDVIGWFALARGDGTGVLRVPIENGGAELISTGKELLASRASNYDSQIVRVVSELGERAELAAWWLRNVPPEREAAWIRWMLVGTQLDVLREVSNEALLSIFDPAQCDVLDCGMLFRASATGIGLASVAHGRMMLDYLKSGLSQPVRIFEEINVLDFGALLFREGPVVDAWRDPELSTLLKRARSAEHLTALSSALAELSRLRSRRVYGRWNEDAGRIIEEHLGQCWLSTRFSVNCFYAYGRSPGSGAECNLADPDRPVVERLASAAARSTDMGWWDECLSERATVDQSQLLLTALLCSGDEQIISHCLPMLDAAVESWPPERLVGTLETITVVGARLNRLNARQISVLEIASSGILAALAMRSRLDQRLKLLSMAIERHRDARVQRILTEHLLDACITRISHTGRWVGTKPAIVKYAPMFGPARYGSLSWRLRAFRNDRLLDKAVAYEVLAKPEVFPTELVGLADDAARQQAGRSAPLVAAVAVQDHWFDQEQPF